MNMINKQNETNTGILTVPEPQDPISIVRPVPLKEVDTESIDFLTNPYMPRGSITLFAGAGGDGKTAVMLHTLAALSCGGDTIFDLAQGEHSDRPPMKSIYFTAEDSVSQVIKPRISLYEADESKIFACNINDMPDVGDISLGSPIIRNYIAEVKPHIVVIDPLQSFLPSGTNIRDRVSMRKAVAPMYKLAAEFNMAVVIIVHTNKRENASDRNRIADSADLWDRARSVLMAGQTGDGTNYISHEKSNYGKRGISILFSISDNGVEFQGTTNKLDCDFSGQRNHIGEDSSKQETAKRKILDTLLDKGQTIHAFKLEHPNEFTETFYRDLDADDIIISSDALQNSLANSISKGTYIKAKSELGKGNPLINRPAGSGNNKKWYIIYPRSAYES